MNTQLHTLIIAAICGLAPLSSSADTGAFSDFSSGPDGWRLSGDATDALPTPVLFGGDPGGYIHGVDSVSDGTWYWEAPAKFLGDNSAAYGLNLTYSQRMRGDGELFVAPDIVLSSGVLTLVYNTTPLPQDTLWTEYTVPLTESGWLTAGLLPVTQAEFQLVLANTTGLKIRGEFISGTDNGDLDSVSLGAPVPIPAAVWLFGSALAGLGVFTRRKQ